MQSQDEISRLLSPKLDHRLKAHIAFVDLSSLSRVSAARFIANTKPHIGLIELVSGATFTKLYDALYISSFHGGERERSDLIVHRLEDEFAAARGGLAPYRVIGIRDHSGRAIAAAQFSVLFLSHQRQAVPYLQYIYVRQEHRRQGLSDLLHTLVLAVAIADGGPFTVPFTLMETEPPVHGENETKRAIAAKRAQIHSKSGSQALMLRDVTKNSILSAHVQPGLEVGEPPVILIWALRENPAVTLRLQDDATCRALLAAYYQSLRDEGFPTVNIALAEAIVERRFSRGVDFCLIPLCDVTREMYVNVDN